jgi:probable HAF family extracellular repeat protein
MRDLGTLGGLHSLATAVNDRGEVVGVSETSDGDMHAFLWRRGKMADLGWKGVPDAINSRGEVVGSRHAQAGGIHAFLWRAGQTIDLNACVPLRPGCVLERAHAVSEDGRILAICVCSGDERVS